VILWLPLGALSDHFRLDSANMKGKQDRHREETMSRKPIILLFVVAAASLGETQISDAQSPYSYPWCAILPGAGSGSGGAMSCYYASWAQCRASMFGIGGNCIESPYYHEHATPLSRHSGMKPRHRRHS
jgi:Protein of unknown function (DUF3551)